MPLVLPDCRHGVPCRSVYIPRNTRAFALPIRHLWHCRHSGIEDRCRRRCGRRRRARLWLRGAGRLFSRPTSFRHFLPQQPHAQRLLGNRHAQLRQRMRQQSDRRARAALGEQHVAIRFQCGESPGTRSPAFGDQSGKRLGVTRERSCRRVCGRGGIRGCGCVTGLVAQRASPCRQRATARLNPGQGKVVHRRLSGHRLVSCRQITGCRPVAQWAHSGPGLSRKAWTLVSLPLLFFGFS
jgi:hypothetical protein